MQCSVLPHQQRTCESNQQQMILRCRILATIFRLCVLDSGYLPGKERALSLRMRKAIERRVLAWKSIINLDSILSPCESYGTFNIVVPTDFYERSRFSVREFPSALFHSSMGDCESIESFRIRCSQDFSNSKTMLNVCLSHRSHGTRSQDFWCAFLSPPTISQDL